MEWNNEQFDYMANQEKEVLNMINLEKEDISYSSLRRNFNVLVKTVMGSDYSNDAINVISSDVQAIKDVRRKVDNLKYDVKMWRNIAIIMMLTSFLLLMFE